MYSLGDLLIELISCVYVYVLGSKHRSATNPTSNSLQFIYFDIFFCSNSFETHAHSSPFIMFHFHFKNLVAVEPRHFHFSQIKCFT